MLKFFSRLERTRNIVLIVIGVVMVLSMVFWGVQSAQFVDNKVSIKSNETVAKVGRENVTMGEIAIFSQMYRGAIPAKQILDSLIPARIVRQEAERLGL